MENVLYTQEGNKYVIRTASKRLDAEVLGIAWTSIPNVYLNYGTSLAGNPVSIGINTPKKILPIQMNVSLTNAAGTTIVSASSVYYSCTNIIDNTIVPVQGLAKMIPLAERIFYTNENNYGYNIKYTQAVLSEADFIQGSGEMLFQFDPDLARALSGNIITTGVDIPAGTYDISNTFIYFELL